MDSRVLFSGNLGGVAYAYAKYLRMRGVDVDLYLWDWEMKKDTRNPLKTDVGCEVLPDWIHFFKSTKFVFGEYRKISKGYDIVHAFNTDPIYAQFTGKPFISHPVGSDAREYAMENGFHQMLLRRAYRKNDAFFFGSLDYYDKVIPRLKARNPIYIQAIQPPVPDPDGDKAPEDAEGADEVFFHPSSHIHGVKGNHLLIEAFARYAKSVNPGARLFMVDWGEDAEKSKSMVGELGISGNVVFKKWLGKKDVYAYMKRSDLVFDQFILPSSSTVQREACAMGKPVVKFMDGNWYKAYDEMPFVSARTVEELFAVMADYHENPEKYRAIGSSAKAFVAKYYDWKYVTDKIVAQYERMVEGRKPRR